MTKREWIETIESNLFRWSAIASLSNDVDKKELLATVKGMEWIRAEIIVSLSNDADKKNY